MLVLLAVSLAVLLYTWIGYPVLVWGGARVSGARPDETPDGNLPLASVVLATRDPDAVIRARVEDLLAADYPGDRLEVIVALDCTREPPDVAGPMPGRPGQVRVVPGDTPPGKASALNAGVRAARGTILVFADAAQRFDAGTIRRLVDALRADPRCAAVSGRLTTRAAAHGRLNVADLYWRYERAIRAWEARIHSSIGVTGAVYAMRADLWRPLPAGLILDDLYTPMHAILRGHRIGFEPAAQATDDRRFEAGDEYRRKVRTLTGVLQLCTWLPGVLLPWRNPVWLQFTSHKLLRLLTPWLVLLVAGSALGVLLQRPGARDLLLVAGALGVLGLAMLAASRKVRDMVWGVALMQVAIVRATMNAARGEWDVWRR